MFILVDYFLTAALSALSGVIYLSVVFPALGPAVILGTVGALVVLALLNLMGVKASAEASAIFAVIAGAMQLAVVAAVAVRLGPTHLFDSVQQVLAGPHLTPIAERPGPGGRVSESRGEGGPEPADRLPVSRPGNAAHRVAASDGDR